MSRLPKGPARPQRGLTLPRTLTPDSGAQLGSSRSSAPALTRLPPHPRDPATTRRNLTGAGARATRVKSTSQTRNRTPLADRIHADQLPANAPCPTRQPPHTRDLDSAPLQLGRRRRTCRPAQAQAPQPRLGARVPTDRPYHYHARHWASLRHEHAITPPAGSGPDPSSDSDTHRRQPPEDHRSGPRVPHSRPGIPAVSSSEDSKDTQRTGNSKKGSRTRPGKILHLNSAPSLLQLIRPATHRGSGFSFLRHR